jgi:uncharacterized membrane protein SpoIIM required for sporulation
MSEHSDALPQDRFEPRSVRFRSAREAEWSELESILDRAFSRGPRTLTPDELERLPLLYRAAVSSLNVARKTALDRALVSYLDALVARAYLAIYTTSRPTQSPLRTLFFRKFPREVRRLAGEMSLSFALLAAGTVTAFLLTAHDPEWYFAFVEEGLSAGRNPGASTEFLRSMLYDGEDEALSFFASWLFSHNASIGLTAFALGFAAGVPTAFLMFTNGTMLGAFLALYNSRGLLVPLLGWLLPHGVPEISAILLCGGAGFVIGRAILAPGDESVGTALVLAGRRGSVVAAGAVVLFLYAGVIEGVFRQVVTDDVLRFAMAAFNAIWLAAWLTLGGRGEEPS